MEYKKYQYQILCEDKAHYHFVRGWLEAKGVSSRKVSSCGELPHMGCGKDFVLKNFANIIAKHHARGLNSNNILIVAIDADNLSVSEVMQNFTSHENSKVFFIIPKWSIDTWFHFILNTPNIEPDFELKSYKSQYRKGTHHAKLGKNLVELLSSNTPLPPSLQLTNDTIKSKKQKLGLL